MTEEVMGYQETLQYTQALRKQVVEAYSQNGMNELIKDEKAVDKMLKALKDMDAQAFGERKNQIEQSTADSSREVAEAMRKFVELQCNANPFMRNPDGSIEGKEQLLPTVDEDKLGEHDLVDGEAEQGVIHETSGEFFTRMEIKRAEREARGEQDD